MSNIPDPGEKCYECGRTYCGPGVQLQVGAYDMNGLNWLLRRGWTSTDESEMLARARRLLDPKTVKVAAAQLKVSVADARERAGKMFQMVWDLLCKVLPLAWTESTDGFGWKCGVCALANRPTPGIDGDQGDAWVEFVQNFVKADEAAQQGETNGERG